MAKRVRSTELKELIYKLYKECFSEEEDFEVNVNSIYIVICDKTKDVIKIQQEMRMEKFKGEISTFTCGNVKVIKEETIEENRIIYLSNQYEVMS